MEKLLFDGDNGEEEAVKIDGRDLSVISNIGPEIAEKGWKKAFVIGLRVKMRLGVKRIKSRNLKRLKIVAAELAVATPSEIENDGVLITSSSLNKQQTTTYPGSYSRIPNSKLTVAEVTDGKAEEKRHAGDKLVLLIVPEECSEKERDEDLEERIEKYVRETSEMVELSVNSLAATSSPRSMKFTGTTQNERLVVMIESYEMHNHNWEKMILDLSMVTTKGYVVFTGALQVLKFLGAGKMVTLNEDIRLRGALISLKLLRKAVKQQGQGIIVDYGGLQIEETQALEVKTYNDGMLTGAGITVQGMGLCKNGKFELLELYGTCFLPFELGNVNVSWYILWLKTLGKIKGISLCTLQLMGRVQEMEVVVKRANKAAHQFLYKDVVRELADLDLIAKETLEFGVLVVTRLIVNGCGNCRNKEFIQGGTITMRFLCNLVSDVVTLLYWVETLQMVQGMIVAEGGMRTEEAREIFNRSEDLSSRVDTFHQGFDEPQGCLPPRGKEQNIVSELNQDGICRGMKLLLHGCTIIACPKLSLVMTFFVSLEATLEGNNKSGFGNYCRTSRRKMSQD
ncbi:hypothetical protein AALP_AA1G194800 [Arabis alpina]|uniref:Uncharacterized protein n=1 Tax=Arabis alpina TaxID=50452 RepID=A0A087HP91_ARAAL|nr:hypothetical protein AALP_AA1G194800 [Arabis alpina]